MASKRSGASIGVEYGVRLGYLHNATNKIRTQPAMHQAFRRESLTSRGALRFSSTPLTPAH